MSRTLGLPVVVDYTAESNLRQRVALTNSRNADWIKAVPDMTGLYPDVKSEDTVILLVPGSRLTEDEVRARLNLEHVRVERETGPVGDAHKGGLRMTGCTTGFTVRNTSTANLSVVTAAHCGTGQRYSRWNPSEACCPNVMNFRGEVHNADADLAWFGTPAHTPEPRFYGGIRVGDGTLQQGTGFAAVGSHLCHQGKTTGYSCGDVTSTNYQPTYAGACPGGPCNSSFVRVFGTNLQNSGGDSGGPWFAGSFVFGAHKGGSCGDCSVPGDTAWYSKISYLPNNQFILTN